MRTDPFRFGTPRRHKHTKSMLRKAVRQGRPEAELERIMLGEMPIADFYGFHPTKSGPGRT